MRTYTARVLWLPLFVITSAISLIQSAAATNWVTNAPMNIPRAGHTTTMLSNGKVLVVGGYTNFGISAEVSSAELYDPATGRWVLTGSLKTARAFHTATLLPNGRVLVAGGLNGFFPLSSAELYDPSSGQWTNANLMIAARYSHTATLLRNGGLLVTGGVDAEHLSISTAELYNSGTGTWMNTGAMADPRNGHTATLLSNGKVLVAGGADTNANSLASAELYDPAGGIWESAGEMISSRFAHTTTAMPDGNVLIAGGYLGKFPQGSYLSSAELYDPSANTWTLTNAMTAARTSHSATLLPNGKLLITGGRADDAFNSISSVELYNPATGTWADAAALTDARYYHTTTLLPNGGVLAVGGFASNRAALVSAELFDPANGTWTNAGDMTIAREIPTATLLPNGKVLMAGGFNNNVFLSSAALYDPNTGVWTNTGALNSPRSRHTATLLPNGNVLVAGGQDSDEITVPSLTELYNPTGTWTTNTPMITPRFSHTATLLPNGKVLVAGGMDVDENSLTSAELYDMVAGTWSVTGSMSEARDRHSATLLPNGKVLVAGGYGEGGSLSSAELYDSATGTWTPTRALGTARAEHTATLMPGGKVLVAGGFGDGSTLAETESYDLATGAWTQTTSMDIPRSAHTATLLFNGQMLVAGGLCYSNGAWVSLAGAELYDPATKKWSPTSVLTTARYHHEATLLTSGNVLVAGGVGGGIDTELYDVGLGCSNSWRPQITTLTLPLSFGSSFAVTGSQFRGVSGASGGNTQDSSSDYPLVQLRSIESGQTTFLLTTNWSTNSFTSLPVWNFPPGWAMVTVFVNGIPSTSSIVNITVPIPTPPTITDARKLTNGSFRLAFTNSVGAVFGALASTNVSLPLSSWTVIGGVTETSPGQFQFTDPQATNSPQRFYRVRAD